MSAKASGKKTKRVGKRIPGKVILPVAVFAIASVVSAIVAGFLIGGDAPTDLGAAIALRPPVAAFDMPPPLAPSAQPGHAAPAPAEHAAVEHAPAEPEPAIHAQDQAQATEPVPLQPEKSLASALPQAAPAQEGDTGPADAPPQLANLPAGPAVLPPDSDPELVERTPQGFLPKVAPDGRQPWQVYARPFEADDTRPRIAVVFTSLGLSSAATEAAIQGLPGGITLAFQPYADNLQHWIQLARAAGHEVLLNLPMEPVDYPSSDPGPQALFTALTPQQNLSRLDWALSRVTGYVGVTSFMGSRFITSRDAMLPVVQTLKDRGLLLLDSRASARSVATKLATELKVPRAINDRFLDTGEVTRVSIDSRLAEAERIALEVGTSVVIGQPYPVTIERVRAWAQGLEERGIALAPLSAVVDLQEDR